MWRQFTNEYLSFSKKERTGIILLLIIIGILLLLPFVYPYFIKHENFDHSSFEKDIVRLKIQEADSSNKTYTKNFDENNYSNYYEPSEKSYYSKSKGELFYFDPNTASAADWVRLGIREKTAETIQKYISKGGHFYKPEDISKIWGLHKKDVDRLLPYVRIESTKKEYSKNDQPNFQKSYTPNNSYKKPSIQSVDINVADTTAFISLPGIGSKLAQRIITFRDKLGGFHSIDQVKETYGLPDSTFIKIKPNLILDRAGIKKININSASLDEMKSHPYLRYNIANAIVQYRNTHGKFASVNDLKKIMIITDEIYNKALPYLTL